MQYTPNPARAGGKQVVPPQSLQSCCLCTFLSLSNRAPAVSLLTHNASKFFHLQFPLRQAQTYASSYFSPLRSCTRQLQRWSWFCQRTPILGTSMPCSQIHAPQTGHHSLHGKASHQGPQSSKRALLSIQHGFTQPRVSLLRDRRIAYEHCASPHSPATL